MRTALITGGARGIGRAIGLDLARGGWNVALCYRTSVEAAAQTAAEIEQRGGHALAVRADVADPAQCEVLLSAVRGAFGDPDVLIHCAGPYHRTGLLSETPAGWRAMLGPNLDGFFYCARLVAPAMIERRWGRILAFSMANADRALAQPQLTAHYIAKSGVLILVRTLAKMLAPYGVTANAISPGFIDSGSEPPEQLEKLRQNIPAGYLGSLDDCVSAARYLLSEEARYVNGANLILSGGWGL